MARNPQRIYYTGPQPPRSYHLPPPSQQGRRPQSTLIPASVHPNFSPFPTGNKPRFEELGYNYGFTKTDPDKNVGYCMVYRTLKNKMNDPGNVCRIRADEQEIRLTELEGPFEEREKVTIFTNDIISYYKFNHRAKFVAVCIDANRREKTGYWFICFDREGQVTAFCEYLNWVFGLDLVDPDEGPRDAWVRYVNRLSGSTHSIRLSDDSRSYLDWALSKNRPYQNNWAESDFTETESYNDSGSSFTEVEQPRPPFAYPRYTMPHSQSKRNFKRW